MSTRQLCRISIIAAIEFAAFYTLSHILYLEAITFLVVSVGLVFPRKEAVLSSVVFGFILVLYLGLTPWSVMYLMIYPCYSLLTSILKKPLLNNGILLILFGFTLSAATGMILDLPFILLNKNVTIYYILTGLKTSLIQGALTGCEFTFIFDSFYKILTKLK